MTYLMMPSEERSFHGAGRILGKSYSLMAKWGRQWSWTHRIGMYEEHYLLLRLQDIEAERDQMWRDQRDIAQSAIAAVKARFAFILSKIDPATGLLDGEEIKPDALVRMMDTALKIERMAVLARAKNAEEMAERNEALAERWADELKDTLEEFMNELNLDGDQRDSAMLAIEKVLATE